MAEKVAETGTQPAALSCVVLPSFADACRLVNSRYSCLVLETHRRYLALSPRYLRKKRSGIQEQLNTELLKYSTGLEGVPVAYDNIKLVNELGDIYDDLGHIYVNVEADFIIFRPQYREKLMGVVNKVAPSHIGCLVHGCFNASIPKPYKMPIEAWQHLGVKVEDQMEFEVFRLDSDAIGVFCIRGNLDRTMELNAIEASNKTIKQEEEDHPSDVGKETENTPMSTSEIDAAIQEQPKKKSKKRKYRDSLSQSELQIENVSSDISGLQDTSLGNSSELIEEIPKKSRKKKKLLDAALQYSDCKSEKDSDHVASCAEISLLEHNEESLVLLRQQTSAKSKKKKKHPDSELEHSFQNGTADDVSFTESSMLEELGEGNVTSHKKIKKKHKKKHDSLLQDPNNEHANGLDESVFSEPAAESPVVTREVPNLETHKLKRQKHLILGSDSSGYLSDNKSKPAKRKLSTDEGDISMSLAEPKAKKKRKM